MKLIVIRLNSRSALRHVNHRESSEHVETRGDDEWTELHEETMAKIRVVIIFIIAQVVR